MSNEWRYMDDRSEETMTAAAAFINSLIEEIRDVGRGRQ
jgi:hypothetical protein